MAKIKMYLSLTEEVHDFGDDMDIAPCPFCGKTDKLFITGKNSYYANLGEHGRATISLSCERCHLDLYEHNEQYRKYETKAKYLLLKWNMRNSEVENGTEKD